MRFNPIAVSTCFKKLLRLYVIGFLRIRCHFSAWRYENSGKDCNFQFFHSLIFANFERPETTSERTLFWETSPVLPQSVLPQTWKPCTLAECMTCISQWWGFVAEDKARKQWSQRALTCFLFEQGAVSIRKAHINCFVFKIFSCIILRKITREAFVSLGLHTKLEFGKRGS